jgi:hypothetical protein
MIRKRALLNGKLKYLTSCSSFLLLLAGNISTQAMDDGFQPGLTFYYSKNKGARFEIEVGYAWKDKTKKSNHSKYDYNQLPKDFKPDVYISLHKDLQDKIKQKKKKNKYFEEEDWAKRHYLKWTPRITCPKVVCY